MYIASIEMTYYINRKDILYKSKRRIKAILKTCYTNQKDVLH